MWKMETTAGTLDALRKALAQTSPELVDFGMRVASVKATALDWGTIGDTWVGYPVTMYLTDAEYLAVKIAADQYGIDLTDYGWLGWIGNYKYPKRKGAQFRRVKMRTGFD